MSVCAVRLAVKAVTDITGGEKLIHNGITKMAVCHFKMKGNLRNDQQPPPAPCRHYTTAPGPLQTVLAVWLQIRAWFLQNQVEVAKLLLLNGSIVKSCEIPKKKAGLQNVYHYDICLWMAFCWVLENCWKLAQWLSALSIERKMEGSHLSIFWQLGGRHQVANPSGFEIQSDLRKSSCLRLWLVNLAPL